MYVLCVCVCVCVCLCVCAQEFLPPGEEALYLVGSCHNKSIFERYVLRSDVYPVNKSGATINGFTVCVCVCVRVSECVSVTQIERV